MKKHDEGRWMRNGDETHEKTKAATFRS